MCSVQHVHPKLDVYSLCTLSCQLHSLQYLSHICIMHCSALPSQHRIAPPIYYSQTNHWIIPSSHHYITLKLTNGLLYLHTNILLSNLPMDYSVITPIYYSQTDQWITLSSHQYITLKLTNGLLYHHTNILLPN